MVHFAANHGVAWLLDKQRGVFQVKSHLMSLDLSRTLTWESVETISEHLRGFEERHDHEKRPWIPSTVSPDHLSSRKGSVCLLVIPTVIQQSNGNMVRLTTLGPLRKLKYLCYLYLRFLRCRKNVATGVQLLLDNFCDVFRSS